MAPGVPGALSITVNKGVIAEGEEVTFSIDTARLLSGITLKWHLEGTAVPSDFEIPSGTITTNGRTVTISVKTVADGLLEGEENFKLVISTQDDQRILSSGLILISDTSKPTPDGQQDFIIASATPYEFIVPDGVTSICAVLIGGGGGGGGGGGYSNASGGGVGLLGQGLNGRAGTGSVPAGGGGSNGTAGISPQSNVGGRGGDYGGGATSAVNYQAQTGLKGGQGGHGAVRIIWGVGRAYPATRTGNL